MMKGASEVPAINCNAETKKSATTNSRFIAELAIGFAPSLPDCYMLLFFYFFLF
uniref:Uncharacterized protein n=1 Tax=Rhizophora mucronata TaxID=61149 RepID=A0A2P2J1E5_RHIMU